MKREPLHRATPGPQVGFAFMLAAMIFMAVACVTAMFILFDPSVCHFGW